MRSGNVSAKAADIVLQMLEEAVEGQWPQVAAAMLEKGYTPKDVVDATGELAAVAGCDNPTCEDDFE